MRVLLISNSLPETGIGQYAQEIYWNLLQIDPDSPKLLTVAGSERGPLWISNILRNLPLVRGMNLRGGNELYHFLNANLGLAVPHHRPCVATFHDLIAFIPSLSRQRLAYSRGRDLTLLAAIRFSSRFAKYADRVICDSHSTLNDAAKFLKVDRSKMRVVHLGVNHDVFMPRDRTLARSALGLSTTKKIVLHVGVDEPRKNIATLMRAFKLLSERFPHALLVRVGNMSSSTKRIVSSLGIQHKVLHLVKPNDFHLYYNAADALVFPSLYEGFGLPPLEAMASGCPVVCSNASSIPEVIGDAGIMLDPHDSKEFADALTALFSDREMHQELAAKGVSRSTLFSWKRCAAETYAVYRELWDQIE